MSKRLFCSTTCSLSGACKGLLAPGSGKRNGNILLSEATWSLPWWCPVISLVQGTKNILAVSAFNEGRNFMGINSITLVGIALIVLGVVALAYQGITYTSRETVIDIGPIHATADTQKTIPLSPLLGGLALAGGIVLVVVGAKKSS